MYVKQHELVHMGRNIIVQECLEFNKKKDLNIRRFVSIHHLFSDNDHLICNITSLRCVSKIYSIRGR